MADVELKGPLFNGGIDIVMNDYCQQAEIDIANEGERMLHERLAIMLKNPTGNYQRHVQAHDDTIDDGGMIYGPWLEGTGSRNAPKTRFKGYQSFRLTAQALNKLSGRIANVTLRSFIGRMGG